MSKPLHTTNAALANLVEQSSFRAHVLLESLIQGDDRPSDKSLIEFIIYLDVAWVLALQTLKSPPKVLACARERLKAWRNARDAGLTEAALTELCIGVGASDTLWRRVSGPLLLEAMAQVRRGLDVGAGATTSHESTEV